MMRTVDATGAALTVQKFILGCGQCGAKPTQSMLQPHNQRGTNSNVNPITMGEASVAQSTRCKVRVPQHGGPQVQAPLWRLSWAASAWAMGAPAGGCACPSAPPWPTQRALRTWGGHQRWLHSLCARAWGLAAGIATMRVVAPAPPLWCLHWGRGRGLTAGQRAAVPSADQSNCPWL